MVRVLTLLSLTILTFLTKCQAGPVRSSEESGTKETRFPSQNHHPEIVFDRVDQIYQSPSIPAMEGERSQVNEQLLGGDPSSNDVAAYFPVKRTRRATLPVPLMSIRMAPIELYGLPEGGNAPFEERERRKFPEVDSRGFDEDIFDEGFGEFHPMKRWPH